MTKKRVLLRIREKLAKLHTYNDTARKLWGLEIAKEMYDEDLDFLSSLLVLLGPSNVE